MDGDNLKILKKILEINDHIIYKNMNLVFDFFYDYLDDILGYYKDFSEIKLLGLWRYYLLENHDKEEFMYDTKVIGVETIDVAKVDGEIKEIYEPIFEWEDLDYYYCLLRIDGSFNKLSILKSFYNWLDHLISENNRWKKLNIQRIFDIDDYADHGNKIFDLFAELKIEDFIKGVSKIANEKNVMESKLIEKDKQLENYSESNIKIKKKLKKYEPESSQDKELMKHFINISLKVNSIPSLDTLASSNYSKSSWQLKMKDNIFLASLYKKVESKLNHKRISQKNKETYLLILNFTIKRSNEIKDNNSINVGAVKKTKLDYNDNISSEVSDMFNDLQ